MNSLRKSQFKSISSRLAVKSLFNSKFYFESTAPDKTDLTLLEVLKSTQVDLLGRLPGLSTSIGLTEKPTVNPIILVYILVGLHKPAVVHQIDK